ncbi:ATP-binding protein [Streptomyces chattanoogensis]|uniref:ATP-binding protein n=1 Tax=Streptomyces chattanoogensis TaxID=66876 RepID=UPI0036A8B7B6
MPDLPEAPLPPAWRIALPHAPAAVPLARALVRTALLDLRAAADGATAELLTAELVAHAVEHTRGPRPIHLVVERVPAGCQVEVHDSGGRDPGTSTGTGRIPDGRGLVLVQALGSAAGCRPTPYGKAVWFTLPA